VLCTAKMGNEKVKTTIDGVVTEGIKDDQAGLLPKIRRAEQVEQIEMSATKKNKINYPENASNCKKEAPWLYCAWL
jgi:hypothetical protein